MNSLTEHLEAWRERRERKREIAHIGPDEMADYGLSRAEFRALALMPSEQIARMEEMARIHGLDPARLDLDPALQVSTALTCAQCAKQRRCRKVLTEGAFQPEAAFCPNAETYRMLAAE